MSRIDNYINGLIIDIDSIMRQRGRFPRDASSAKRYRGGRSIARTSILINVRCIGVRIVPDKDFSDLPGNHNGWPHGERAGLQGLMTMPGSLVTQIKAQ